MNITVFMPTSAMARLSAAPLLRCRAATALLVVALLAVANAGSIPRSAPAPVPAKTHSQDSAVADDAAVTMLGEIAIEEGEDEAQGGIRAKKVRRSCSPSHTPSSSMCIAASPSASASASASLCFVESASPSASASVPLESAAVSPSASICFVESVSPSASASVPLESAAVSPSASICFVESSTPSFTVFASANVPSSSASASASACFVESASASVSAIPLASAALPSESCPPPYDAKKGSLADVDVNDGSTFQSDTTVGATSSNPETSFTGKYAFQILGFVCVGAVVAVGTAAAIRARGRKQQKGQPRAHTAGDVEQLTRTTLHVSRVSIPRQTSVPSQLCGECEREVASTHLPDQ